MARADRAASDPRSRLAFDTEEIRAWEAELDRELGPAAFGENLTTEGVDVSGAALGRAAAASGRCLA